MIPAAAGCGAAECLADKTAHYRSVDLHSLESQVGRVGGF